MEDKVKLKVEDNYHSISVPFDVHKRTLVFVVVLSSGKQLEGMGQGFPHIPYF